MPVSVSMGRLRSPLATAIVVATIGAVAAATPGAVQAASSSATVTIKDIAYHPQSVTIRRGGHVKWRFVDPQVSHNVRSRGSKRFHSSPTKLTGTYTVTFSHSGTYSYHCTIHPSMHGKVIVR